jgi:hypothetical protein
LDGTGLPKQIVIKADATELPLELRGQKVEIAQADLQAIGRGEQLRAPVRLVAQVGGNQVPAEPDQPCKPELKGGRVVARAALKLGKVTAKVEVAYAASGRMDVSLTYGGGGEVGSLALVLDISGPVDTVVPGLPVDDKVKLYNAAEFALRSEEGLAWANTGESVREGARNLPGMLSRAYVGSGDRGFTWLAADTSKGFMVENKAPTMVLERGKAGEVTWRIYLVNHETKLRKEQTASFSLLVHPARTKPAGIRPEVWTAPLENLPRADKALDCLADGNPASSTPEMPVVSLEGPACGDALSADQNLAAVYPLSLFRYLAGTHTGMSARLRTNACKLVKPGQSPAVDRVALGRALLHDIGVDASTLAHLMEAAAVVKALEEFGCFKDDGMTEFIPYWRTRKIVRYGEEFAADDTFSLTTEDPLAHVHLSAWRRPNAGAAKALMVIVNESPKPVREQLYIHDRTRLFGGANTVRAREIVGAWDMSAIPADSDWSKERLQSQAVFGEGEKRTDVALLDMTDKGFVAIAKDNKGFEVYGPVYVPAYGFRLIYGAGK